jgi:hypothetical protein
MPQKRSLGLLVNTTRAFEGGEVVSNPFDQICLMRENGKLD